MQNLAYKSYIEEAALNEAKNHSLLKRIAGYPLLRCLALYRFMPWQFSLTAVLFLLANAAMAYQLWCVGHILNDIQKDNPLIPTGHSINYDHAKLWISIMVGIAALRGILQYAAGVTSLIIGQELLYILRERIQIQVQRLDLIYHWQHGVGELVTRTTRDADKVRDALINFWRQVFEATIWILISVITLSWYQLYLGLGTLLFIVSGLILFLKHTEKLVRLDRAVGDSYDKVNESLSESINGIRVIKSFGLEERQIDAFSNLVYQYVNNLKASLAYAAAKIPLPQIVIAFSQVWVLVWGAKLVEQNVLNIGQLVSALLITNALVFRVEGIGRVMQIFADARSSAARIWDLLDEQPHIFSGEQKLPATSLGFKLVDVTTYAPKSDKEILSKCNLEVQPGETVAIVGKTGSGKSTLAGLIPRLLDTDRGEIYIGNDISGWQTAKSIALNDLRKKIYVVTQDTFLFSDSLASNLRLTNPSATDEELLEALKLAGAEELLERLDNGLDTRIGDRGITLSGGQRQRVSLARAFLANPSILIIDEATSALDAVTERKVLNNLKKVSSQTGQPITLVIIASKVSTILLANRVLLLSNGRIEATGTHEVLVKSSKEYQSLVGATHG